MYQKLTVLKKKTMRLKAKKLRFIYKQLMLKKELDKII